MNSTAETKISVKGSHPIIIGILFTIVILTIFVLSLALVLYFTNLSENNIFIISLIATSISVIIGGFFSGKKAGCKGWLYGGFVGLIYGIMLIIITFLAYDANFELRQLVFVLLNFLLGAFGGIFGVNLKK